MADIWLPLRAGSDVVFLGGAGQLRDHERSRVSTTSFLTRTPPRSSATNSATRKIWTACSPAGIRRHGSISNDVVGLRRTAVQAAMRPVATSRSAIRRCSIRDCVFQILARHFARYTPAMVEEVCGIPADAFAKVAEAFCRRLRTGSHGGDLLRGRAGRSTRPACRSFAPRGDSSAAARQHRQAWRRHPGASGPRVHPGIDRHPDALRSLARLSADADARRRRPVDRRLHREERTDTRLVEEHRQVHRVAAEGLVRQRRDASKTLRLRLAAAHQRRPLALRATGSTWRDGKIEGLFVMGQNPAVGAPNARLERRALSELEMARRARHGRDGDRDLLARFA